MSEPLDPARRRAALPRTADQTRAGPNGASCDSVMLSATLEAEGEPFALAVLAEHADALLPPLGGERRSSERGDPHASAFDRLEPEDRAQQPRAAGADEAGDAEHLAAVQRERGVAWLERVDRRGLPRRAARGARG